jgi:hypothetical protein
MSTLTITIDLDAMRTSVERYRVDWVKARDARDKALAECSHMPDNYWQAEHRARGKYSTALALLDAFTMADDTPDARDYRR